MVPQEIKVGDIVRHIHIMSGTNLSVIDVMGNKLMVRYANQGIFQTQDLFLNEVELLEVDEDEFN
jgi:hypothetical protein